MSLPATLTLPYGTQHERQHVLLSLPPGDARAPLLVFIHGGAWRSNAASDHARLAAHLATHGVAVALVEYRLSTSDGGAVRHPQHAQDASDALSFLLRSGDEAWRSRIDPRNTVVAGHSVGAHMCLSMALCAEAASVGKGEVERMPGLPERSQIKAWVGIAGIYDIVAMLRAYPSYVSFVEQAFGAPPPDCDLGIERYAPASLPAWPVPPQPPRVYLAHSLDDELLDVQGSKAAQTELQRKGCSVQTYWTLTGTHDESLQTEAFWGYLLAIVRSETDVSQH